MYVQEERTMEEIGAEFGITRERVRQLLKSNFGIVGNDTLAQRREAKAKIIERTRERVTLENKGVSVAQLKELQRAGFTRVFSQKRANVLRSGGEWGLTLGQFYKIWHESGHLSSIGKGREKYGMTTIDRSMRFVVGNVEISLTTDINSAVMFKYWATKPERKRRERKPPREKPVVPPRILPDFPPVSSRDELRRAICQLKGSATAREIMNAYGLRSRNVVIGIWNRARMEPPHEVLSR